MSHSKVQVINLVLNYNYVSSVAIKPFFRILFVNSSQFFGFKFVSSLNEIEFKSYIFLCKKYTCLQKTTVYNETSFLKTSIVNWCARKSFLKTYLQLQNRMLFFIFHVLCYKTGSNYVVCFISIYWSLLQKPVS